MPGFINEYQIPAPTITQSGDTLFSSLAVSYQWYSVDSGLIIGAVNYNYIPTYAGSFYVIVTDTNGCEGASNTIVITGVYSLSNYQHPIIIFPNPNDGMFTILVNDNLQNVSIRIINSIGQTVYFRQDLNSNLNAKIDVEMQDVACGLYSIEIINSTRVYRQKLIFK
nr:T9SS type A sorting domain-containing protein [Bacteroidota bacterium]